MKLTDAINYIVERNRQVVNACYKRSTCVGVHQVHIPYKNHMTGDKHRRDNRNRHANQRPGEDQNLWGFNIADCYCVDGQLPLLVGLGRRHDLCE